VRPTVGQVRSVRPRSPAACQPPPATPPTG
jgi:hypothetical protein